MPLFKAQGKIIHVSSDPAIGHGPSLGDKTLRQTPRHWSFEFQELEHRRQAARRDILIILVCITSLGVGFAASLGLL